MRLNFILLLFLFPLLAFSQQYVVFGKIADAHTGLGLAFVSLTANGGTHGCYSDIDGRFRISNVSKIVRIKATYLGYDAVEMNIDSNVTSLNIKLYSTSIELNSVTIVPGINPANRIIRSVLMNREQNDPEKLNSFSYTAYEKTIIKPALDSLFQRESLQKDTSLARLRHIFSKQDIIIIESVYERKFKAPDNDFKKVLASRVSGLQDPSFTLLISMLQPNSFYKEVSSILDKNYVNPISTGCFSKYYYRIEDTLFNKGTSDTTYLISFRPLLNRNFDGLKGVLYINTDGYALQSVIASPARQEAGISISVQQLYEKVDSVHWFPVQLNTNLEFTSLDLPVGKDSSRTVHMVGIGKTYLKEIKINQSINKKDFNQLQMVVDPESTHRDEDYWTSYRQDSLTAKDHRTYAFMDSIGKAEKLDQKVKFLEALATGRIPVWKLDVEMDKIVRYTGYEGWCFGLGLSTNRRFSERFKLEGYGSYGFKDDTWKYGGEFAYVLSPRHELEINLAYKKDVFETGGIELFDVQKLNIYERFRNYLIVRMDKVESYRFSVKFRSMKWFLVSSSLYQVFKTPTYSYSYIPSDSDPGAFVNPYKFTEWVTAFRFAYKETYMKNARTQISMGTKYPVLQFQYVHGFKGLAQGQFKFDRVDFRISESFYTKYLGKTTLIFRGGIMTGNLPITELYNGNGSLGQFTIYAMNSFATMAMNEFASDRYLAFYFHHNFGKLLIRKKYFQPEIALVGEASIGSIQHPEYQDGYAFKTMEKGFYESGILLNKLLVFGSSNIGFGAFYRMGAYAFEKPEDNLCWKFSFVMPF